MDSQNPENFSTSSSSVNVEEMTDVETSETLVATQGYQKPHSPEIDGTQLLQNSNIAGTSKMDLIPEKELASTTISTDSANMDKTDLNKIYKTQESNLHNQSPSYNESDKTASLPDGTIGGLNRIELKSETEFAVPSSSTNLVNEEETTLKRRISDTKEPNLHQESLTFAEPSETTPLLGNPGSETNRMNFEPERTSQVSERNLRVQTRRSRRRNRYTINRFIRWFDQTALGGFINENWMPLICLLTLIIIFFVFLMIIMKNENKHKKH